MGWSRRSLGSQIGSTSSNRGWSRGDEAELRAEKVAIFDNISEQWLLIKPSLPVLSWLERCVNLVIHGIEFGLKQALQDADN